MELFRDLKERGVLRGSGDVLRQIPIPEKWKQFDTWAMLFRRLVYIACFAWLIYLDHIIGSAGGDLQQGLKFYTGVVLSIIILTAYRIKDFIKIPYAVWVILFFVLRPVFTEWVAATDTFAARVDAKVWNIGFWGLIVIRMIYQYVAEKKKPNMKWPFFAVLLAMMLGMVLSINDEDWYLWFFPVILCFYLTNYTQKQLNTLFSGMVEGIILGFIFIQWQALLYRPYDELRYEGLYANCNMNALFYIISYLAVLGKWYLMKLKRRPFILMVPFILLGGAIWALTVFTMCRTALIAMAIFTVLFVVFQVISRRRRKLLELVINTGLIVLAIFLMFKPTYNVVRYVPAYVNEPLYLGGEDENQKVQADEAFDSEKYIEYEEMLEGAFGRMDELKNIFGGGADKTLNMLFPALQVNASENAGTEESEEREISELEKQLLWEWSGRLKEYPMLTDPDDFTDSVKIRQGIYECYMRHMNFKGHTMAENGVWVTPEYFAGHAHNIWIQFNYDHGWIVGILFIAVIGLTAFCIVRGLIRHRQGAYYYRTFIVSGIIVTILSFGMFEMCWIYGQIALLLLFMAFRVMCHRDEPKSMK